MVWAGICGAGKSKIQVFRGSQDSKKHCETLRTCYLAFMRDNKYSLPDSESPDTTYFCALVQDNASIHTSAHTKALLKDNDIDVMKWPSKSPDLNPIENLWYALKIKVYSNQKPYRKLEDLEKAILRAWDDIQIGRDIKPLIDSIPRRLKYVVANKGEFAPY
jgi:hypothetical protein